MNFDSITDAVLHNQVVTGLSFTALLGALAYQLRNIPHLLSQGCLRFATVQLTVISTDMSFEWIDRWLAHQPYSKRAKMLTLRARDDNHENTLYSGGANEPPMQWALSPGPGLHMFWWRHRPVFLERRFLSKEGSDEGRRNKPVEMLRFRTIGRSQRVTRRLIEDVRNFSLSSDMVSIRVWTDYWITIPSKSQRPLDTIILRSGQMERIIADLRWFHNARSWYIQRGIPYRRGYLFAGPPGSGKTSLVLALAGYFNRPICMLSLSNVSDDPALVSAFHQAPSNAIVLIEDVDCAFPAQQREEGQKETSRLTKAGLLNAIDGIATPDGRIFIMTTNFPERLDAALVRPGRADVHEHFGYLVPTDQVRMAQRFYTNPFTPLLAPVSPAALQAAFMLHPDDPHAAHKVLAQDDDFSA